MAATISHATAIQSIPGSYSSCKIHSSGSTHIAQPLSQQSSYGSRRMCCSRIRVSCSIADEVANSTSSSSAYTLYDVLGVAKDVDFGEIKTAYRQQAKRWHPDALIYGRQNTQNDPKRRVDAPLKNSRIQDSHEEMIKSQAQSAELFLRVRHAYEVLSDPTKRFVYDQSLSDHYQPFVNNDIASSSRWHTQVAAIKHHRAAVERNTWGSRMRSHWLQQH